MIGRPYTARSEPVTNDDINITPLKQWDKVKHMAQGFWKRWHMEYLTSLQHRQKWYEPMRNIKENDIVVLKEANLPQSSWPLARVIKTHPTSDGKVRVVTIKTTTGEYIRPIAKLAVLPSSAGQESFSMGENVEESTTVT